MCERGTTIPVLVKIPADLSATGKARWKWEDVDSCIVDIVAALQASGVDMRGSCCGHYKGLGTIRLQDGRILIVTDQSYLQPVRWLLRAAWWVIKWRVVYYKRQHMYYLSILGGVVDLS